VALTGVIGWVFIWGIVALFAGELRFLPDSELSPGGYLLGLAFLYMWPLIAGFGLVSFLKVDADTAND
tara:strand:- start:150 stop:353 length:204 start_codon:yes stop_codon:yes gene_type:complete